MIPFTDFATLEILVVVVVLVLVALYFTDSCNLRNRASNVTEKFYSYSGPYGPSYWKQKFTESNGACQSPINISLQTIVVLDVDSDIPLSFSEQYNITPTLMSVYNDGYSVTVYARWECLNRPIITGGPCNERYEFLNGRFRWGLNNHEGSEHTIECKAFAMEFQAIHLKCGKRYKNLSQAAKDNGVLIVTYFYEITPVINPYLQPLMAVLPKIQNPHVCSYMEPIPLFFLMPSFIRNYVSYLGSLTHPPCTEGVQWIIQTEPLGIAASQVAQFRKLFSFSDLNRRPVQNVNGRDMTFYV